MITTLLGLSSFPTDHFLNVGMPGMHGMAYSSMAINEADLLISLGMRFDDRVTGRLSAFAPQAKVIHVDIDPSEISKNVKATVPIVGDLKRVLRALVPQVQPALHTQWVQHIEQMRLEHPSHKIRETEQLIPQYILKVLSDFTDGKAIIVTGVGQHQMWAAQICSFKEPNSLITSGGLGAMGYEVPAAIGAKVARPDRPVWSIAGDGGFQMTLCDLATAAENNISVKFAIINNNFLGMVRQWQDFFYNKTYTATGYTRNPDFVKLAEAYGIPGMRVTDKAQVEAAIQWATAEPGSVVIDFMVEPEENVYPMIPAGESLAEMIEEPQQVFSSGVQAEGRVQ